MQGLHSRASGNRPHRRARRADPGGTSRRWWSVLLAGLVLVPGVLGHDGPEHEVEEFTERIEAGGETPELLVGRAAELRVLGRYAEAERDLSRAVHLDPGSIPALREWARLQLSLNRWGDAVATVSRALTGRPPDPAVRAELLLLRAEARRDLGELKPALDDCRSAIGLHGSNPEWYLVRSEIQRRLGMRRSRVGGVEEGYRRTGAGVLAVERVEALLDAGRYRTALKRIEPELQASRVQSRWLIRRGRARIGLGEREAGEGDLREALAEMEPRLERGRPDGSLLLDRGTALALLGNREGARECLDRARRAGAEGTFTARLESLIENEFPGTARRPSPDAPSGALFKGDASP